MPSDPPSVARALTDALKAAPATPADRAAVALAKRYAAEIDGGGDLVKLGPALLAALAALGLTPAARAAVAKGGAPDGKQSGPGDSLAKLRAERARSN